MVGKEFHVLHGQKSEAVENRMQQSNGCWGNIQCCQQYCSFFTPDCQLIQVQQYCSILLTTRNNVAPTTLLNPVFNNLLQLLIFCCVVVQIKI